MGRKYYMLETTKESIADEASSKIRKLKAWWKFPLLKAPFETKVLYDVTPIQCQFLEK